MTATSQRSSSAPGRLGATVTDAGTRFEVWAPDATSVEVRIEAAGDRTESIDVALVSSDDALGDVDPASGETESRVTVDRTDGGGRTWAVEVPGVGDGDRYRFRLDGGDWLADPASRRQPDGVHGPSAVVDRAAFAWSDDGWAGRTIEETILYELHVGTFTPAGTFTTAIGQLDRLVDLGVTTVEVMPVAAFPGTRNWGYDGVFPFAVQESYGGPSGLAAFVDAAHARGLAVVLDVVYNHFGPEGNVVTRYAPYFTDAYATPWGAAVNVADRGSDAVRRYFIENATGWIEDYHLDGLRLDAVHAIVDPTPSPFVAELTAAVHDVAARLDRSVVVTIESSANDPRIVRPTDDQGWGADAVWDDDVHHALRVALTGDRHEYYAGYDGVSDLAMAWERRWVYSGQHSPVFGRRHGAPADEIDHAHFVVFDTNHDHVGNTPGGARLLADAPLDDPRRRLAAAVILLSPFTPMLFMGEEYGEVAPFPYFVDHGDPDLVEAVRQGRRREFGGADWAGTDVADPADPATFERAILDPGLADEEPHRSLLAMYTELIRLRTSEPILTDPHASQHVSVVGDAIYVVRSSSASTASLVFNFGSDELGSPDLDDADVIAFDSDDPRWSGADAGPESATATAPGSPIAPGSAIAPRSTRLILRTTT